MPGASIYDFHNYRDFLKLEIERLRAKNPKLSYRNISKKIGVASPNFIFLVMQGKRNLSLPMAKKLAKFFEFNQDETTFFSALVGYNQAADVEEKLMYQSQMFSVRGYLRAKPVEHAQYKYFSDWAVVVLREMIELQGFKLDTKKIAAEIHGGEVSAKQIEDGLKLLQELRLVDHSLEGTYHKREAHLEFPAGLSHGFIFAYHKAVLEKAEKALFNLKSAQREFSVSTISFDSAKMTEAKEFLTKMRTEFIARFGESKDSDAVAQFSYQFFEMAKIPKK